MIIKMLLLLVVTFVCKYGFAVNNNGTSGKPRQLGALFNVVNFPNNPCRGTNNLNGTCVANSACIGTGGQNQGTCAQNFGICCFYSISTCGGEITRNQTYIQNPGYPSAFSVSSDRICTFNIYRINSDVCQLRFDFPVFDLGGPFKGSGQLECSTDTDWVTFTPAGAKTNGINLCGYNPGQHVYIDMGTSAASPSFAKMTMSFDANNQASKERFYNIMVSQIECSTNYHAPIGCDQYYFGNRGTGVIQSFNYDQPTSNQVSRLAGNLRTCIRREKEMCVIGYTPPDVDSEISGFAVNVNPAAPAIRGRMGCGYTASGATNNPAATAGFCTDSWVRIPQGTNNLGNAPYVLTSPPAPAAFIACDRFCGKRLCNLDGGCSSSDHLTIYSKMRPFELQTEFAPITSAQPNRGYKLNYFQQPCN